MITFAITHTVVHDQFFPSLAAFSGSTKPTSSAVGAMIDENAGVLGAKLLALGSNPTTISTDAGATYPFAYQWCRRYVSLGAAIQVFRAMAGGGPVPKEWVDDLERMLKSLDTLGLSALGDAPAPAQDARGPYTHIATHSLDTGDEADISDAVPEFRIDDEL